MPQFEQGNPGRPKGAVNKTTAQMKEYLEPFADDILAALVELGLGGWVKIPDPDDPNNPEAMLDEYAYPSRDEKVRITALKEMADRLWGKPRQSLEVGLHQRSLADLMNAEDDEGDEEG